MFVLPGLSALLFFVYVRPQEFLPALTRVPMLYILCALSLLGFVLDVRLRLTRLRPTPLLVWGVLFFAWSTVTVALTARQSLVKETVASLVSFFFFLVISQGVQTFRAIAVVAATLASLALFITGVALHQAQGTWTCHRLVIDDGQELWVPDGRGCETRTQCYESALDPEADWRCERVGLLETNTVEGRVKYRGIMEDPNELALVMSVALPLALALAVFRPTLPRMGMAVLAFLLIGVCTVLTRSRSGQMAFASVLGVYMLKRFRWRGVVAAALLAAPVLVLGGRSDSSADESTMQRIEAWVTGLDLFRASPLFGVGKGQFAEHHWLTAHNSFVLVLAETGAPGVFLWTGLIYMAVKSLLLVSRRSVGWPSRAAGIWATASLSSLAALLVSCTFLSFAYHNVFWIYLGLAGAVFAATRRHDPDLRVRFTWRDATAIVGLDVVLSVVIFIYGRWKGA